MRNGIRMNIELTLFYYYMKKKYRTSQLLGGFILKQMMKTIILASSTLILTFLLIKYPEQSFEASLKGLHMWWEIVFPSLLPFFITAEILIGFGVVTFIGVLFEPIMRPIFNVPGVGSFAWIMGMASGYPSGAKISSRLREENQLTRIEAERLISFTNNASPLFIFGAVSVGFFHDANLGLLIAICHYLGNTVVGFCMRFYGRKVEIKQKTPIKTYFSFRDAFRQMHYTRMNDKRPFGEVIGDAILNSIKTLIMIGGFIILFSVMMQLLIVIGVTPIFASFLQYGMRILSLPIELTPPLISGMFEITQGAQLTSQINMDTMLPKAIVISFILGFNGFSVQAQVSSIIAKTDIRFTPYFISRILHGFFASIFTILLFKPLYFNRKVFHVEDIPVIQDHSNDYWIMLLEVMKQIGPFITIICLMIASIMIYKRIKLKT